MKKELEYEILNQVGIVSTSDSGWTVELNRISWNGKAPKYDLRSWASDHSKMGKGVTLSEDEIRALALLLNKEITFLDGD